MMWRRQKSLPRVSSSKPFVSEDPPVGDSRQGGDGPQTLPFHGIPKLSGAVRPSRVDQLVPTDPRMLGWRLYDPSRDPDPHRQRLTLLTNGCRCRAADVVDDDWLEPSPAEPSPAEELAAARAESEAQLAAVRAEIAARAAQRRAEMDARLAAIRASVQSQSNTDEWE
jgi:hypothetical protein